LTLPIVVIEVVLIAAVMLGPGDHATIARASVMAVSMLIMNLVLGLCLLVGGLRHGPLALHRGGPSSYAVTPVALAALAIALPAALGTGGGYSPVQALVIGVLTVLLYAVCLWRQTGAQAADCQEPGHRQATDGDRVPLRETLFAHRGELLTRSGLLI